MTMSFMAINRIVEEQAASDEKYRKRLEKVGKLLLSTVRQMPEQVIVNKLRSLGLEVDRSILDGWCGKFMSAQDLSTNLMIERDLKYEGNEDDWIWMGLTVLWEWWFPNVPNFEMLDDKIDAGYQMSFEDAPEVCETWLAAWSDVHKLMNLHKVNSLDVFDGMFAGSEIIANWMQDVTQALYDAGIDEPKYLWDRIRVCNDILQLWQRDDRQTIENAKSDLAESYFLLCDRGKAESLFRGYLDADPQWGWGWIGWSDCYHFHGTSDEDISTAERILKEGMEVSGVRDREDMLDRLLRLYEDAGRKEDAKSIQAELNAVRKTHPVEVRRTSDKSLQMKHTLDFENGLPLEELANIKDYTPPQRQIPMPAGKLGRNDPCPCGSGKKYKKCCM